MKKSHLYSSGRRSEQMKQLALICLLAAALVAPGCSRALGSRDEAGGKKRVGIVFDIGGKDDKSFNTPARGFPIRSCCAMWSRATRPPSSRLCAPLPNAAMT